MPSEWDRQAEWEAKNNPMQEFPKDPPKEPKEIRLPMPKFEKVKPAPPVPVFEDVPLPDRIVPLETVVEVQKEYSPDLERAKFHRNLLIFMGFIILILLGIFLVLLTALNRGGLK